MSVQPKSLKGKTWLQAASCPCNSFSKPLNALHKHHQVLPHGKALATDQPQKILCVARYLVLGDSFQLAHAWNMLELLAQMLWIAVSNRI